MLYINIWRTISISALACYISAENLLLNVSYCWDSAALPLDPAGDYPQTICAFCSCGWLELPRGRRRVGNVFQMQPYTNSRDTKTSENTSNYLSHFCYMYLVYIYLTLLPSRPNLVNIALYGCHQNYSHQMPDFSFKMHQTQFRFHQTH